MSKSLLLTLAAFVVAFASAADAQPGASWVKAGSGRAGLPPYNVGRGIAVDRSGDIVHFFAMTDSGTYDGQFFPKVDAPVSLFIAKYSSDGTTKWIKQISGIHGGGAWPEKLAIDSANNILIGGAIEGDSIHIEGGYFAPGGFVAKLSPVGAFLWVRPMSDVVKGVCEIFSVAAAPNGDIWATGTYHGVLRISDKDTSRGFDKTWGPDNGFIVKLNSDGSPAGAWSARARESIITDVAVSTDGTVGVVGSSQFDTINFRGMAGRTRGYFVGALKAGTWLWTRGQGGSSADYGRAITVDNEGNFYAASHLATDDQLNLLTKTFDGKPVKNLGSLDIVLSKYSAAGEHLWSQSAGSKGSDNATRLEHINGLLYLAGSVPGPAIIGGKTAANTCGDDGFIAELDLNGQTNWIWTLRGSDKNEFAADITADASHQHIYATGTSASSLEIDGIHRTSPTGTYQVWIAAFDVTKSPRPSSWTGRNKGLAVDNGTTDVGGSIDGLLETKSGALLAHTVGDVGAIFRSSDRGMTWSLVAPNTGSLYFTSSFDQHIVISTQKGYNISTDDGLTWTKSPVQILYGTVPPAKFGASYFIASSATITTTGDDGLSWTSLATSPANIAAIASNTNYLFAAGALDSVTGRGFYRSSDAGLTWDSGWTGLASAKVVSRIFVVGTALMLATNATANGKSVTYRSLDEGKTWSRNESPLLATNWTGHDSMIFSYGAAHAYSTSDLGVTWKEITDDIDPCLTQPSAFLATSADLYAGTANGLWGRARETPPLAVRDPASQIQVYLSPNPAVNDLQVSVMGSTIDRLELLDLLGHQVLNTTPRRTSTHVSLSDLPRGAYFLRITSEDGITSRRIVKE
jgi:hypothetical protein